MRQRPSRYDLRPRVPVTMLLILVCAMVVAGCTVQQEVPRLEPGGGEPEPVRSAVAELSADDLLTGPMGEAFRTASAETGVPVELLVALGYTQSRINHHAGEPSISDGYGIMHLLSRPDGGPLEQAAQLLGLPVQTLKDDPTANIRGAAVLLAEQIRHAHGGLPEDLGDWYPAIAAMSGEADWVTRSFADLVYQVLTNGVDLTLSTGEHIHLQPREVIPQRGPLDSVQPATGSDYDFAHWVPAHPENLDPHNRPVDGNPIEFIVIHVGQGTYNSIIRWFQNPRSEVSAHYVVRSYDGQVTQMVHERDVAWHAGNTDYNHRSIGIEHEGWVNDCSWFTDEMYRSTARLVGEITTKYGIPRSRERIIGHNEVPGATHTDPGPCWDWDYFMSLLRSDVSVVVDDGTPGRFYAGPNWGLSKWNAQRFGDTYRFTVARPDQDSAFYKVPVPVDGEYNLYVWFPGHPLYHSAVRVVVWEADPVGPGRRAVPVYLDQRRGGGWQHVGLFPLRAGDDWIIQVTRAGRDEGYIIADAVMIVLQDPR